jgi:hypothetical protein
MSAEEVTEAHKGVGCRDLFVAATNAIEAWDVLTDTLRPNAFHNIKTAVEELRDALFAINPSVADYCKHWEVRAERAEAELASERGRLDYIRAELALLREWQREVIQNANAHHAERKDAIARAESAEVELANIRALADRRNERDHSQDTTHQLVAALDQALDIAQAELAQFRELDAERARMRQIAVDKRIRTPTPRTDEEAGSLIDAEEVVPADFSRELERELAKERARLDWVISSQEIWLGSKERTRAAIDAAMKEGA